MKIQIPKTLALAAIFGMISLSSNVMAVGKNKRLEVSTGFETAADSLSFIYFNGSYFQGNHKFINYVEFNFLSEWFSYLIADHPTVQKIGIFAGHQFQVQWKYFFIPTTIGLSSGVGIDRGVFRKSIREDSTCIIICNSDDYYERRKYFSAGLFLEITPSIYINGFNFGIKTIANYDTRHFIYGAGLSFGLPLEIFESE